jgi:hypothetical protein
MSLEPSSGLDDAPEENPECSNLTTSGSNREAANSKRASVACIFVDHDQFFEGEKSIAKMESSSYKAVFKTMKNIAQRCESFVSGLSDLSLDGSESLPVFAVADVSFFVLRDFGTALMKLPSNEKSASGACLEIIEQYPKHKRVLKTLGVAIDNFMRRAGFWVLGNSTNDPHPSRHLISMLLYSKADDRFDMVTLARPKANSSSVGNNIVKNSRKKHG